ncbi:MAG: hypothetical protein JXA93_00355 [Anaerolineae bacterium]|nr:hypothetical protein [Anaerolineae bacterium]
METTTYSSYQEAAQAYMARFRAMREAPPSLVAASAAEGARRGPGMVDTDALVDHAAEIASVSAAMVPMARDMLDAPEAAVREAISGQILAQAAAELQLATELLGVAAGEQVMATGLVTRAARGSALALAIDDLECVMMTPLEAGLALDAEPRRSMARAAVGLDEAKQQLHDAALLAAKSITSQVQEFGGDVAWSLVFQTEWAAVVDGAALLRKDVAAKLDAVQEGAGALLEKAVTAATATLLNVWDKIMALLGKDAEDKARKQVKEWLEQIKQEGKIALFATLIDSLYRVQAFEQDLAAWLATSKADTERLAATTTAVSAVADSFQVLVGRMSTLEDVIGLAKIVKIPQVLVIVAGVQVALLTTLIYLGHDYLGYQPLGFFNVTRGVSEVIRGELGV